MHSGVNTELACAEIEHRTSSRMPPKPCVRMKSVIHDCMLPVRREIKPAPARCSFSSCKQISQLHHGGGKMWLLLVRTLGKMLNRSLGRAETLAADPDHLRPACNGNGVRLSWQTRRSVPACGLHVNFTI